MALLFVVIGASYSSNIFAQACTVKSPNVFFQVGFYGQAFLTAEAAGEDDCVGRGDLSFGRVDYHDEPELGINGVGVLVCKRPDGSDRPLHPVLFSCCGVGRVLKNGFCTTIIDGADKLDGCSLSDNPVNTKNPCNVATGNKFRSETDITNGLKFTRYYNSRNLADLGLGLGWRHSYQKRIIINGSSVNLIAQSGKGEPWTETSGQWIGDNDTDKILTQNDEGYEVINPDDSIEQYNLFGQIVREIDSNGFATSYSYGLGGILETVIDQYGQSLRFEYSNRQLISLTDSLNHIYRFTYDEAENLTSVIYPDTTPNDDSDNPRKIYHYENEDYPNHLTGITDENGERYGNFAYDREGRAILSELGTTTNTVGQERIELDFQ